ncbi:hypothetical protein KCU93_g50, partial [Aureobasidium melanogenum]
MESTGPNKSAEFGLTPSQDRVLALTTLVSTISLATMDFKAGGQMLGEGKSALANALPPRVDVSLPKTPVLTESISRSYQVCWYKVLVRCLAVHGKSSINLMEVSRDKLRVLGGLCLTIPATRVRETVTVELKKFTILLQKMLFLQGNPMEGYLNGHAHIQNTIVYFIGL